MVHGSLANQVMTMARAPLEKNGRRSDRWRPFLCHGYCILFLLKFTNASNWSSCQLSAQAIPPRALFTVLTHSGGLSAGQL